MRYTGHPAYPFDDTHHAYRRFLTIARDHVDLVGWTTTGGRPALTSVRDRDSGHLFTVAVVDSDHGLLDPHTVLAIHRDGSLGAHGLFDGAAAADAAAAPLAASDDTITATKTLGVRPTDEQQLPGEAWQPIPAPLAARPHGGLTTGSDRLLLLPQLVPPARLPRWRRRLTHHQAPPARAARTTAIPGIHAPATAHPAPDNTPPAISSGMTQHAAHASPARPVSPGGICRRAQSASVGIRGSSHDGGEWDGTARRTGARDQVVAAGVDSSAQRSSDDLQVGDLRLHLGQFRLGTSKQPYVRAPAVAVPACFEEVGDLVEGEPEPLRRLDHLQGDDRLLRVQPVPAEAAVRLGEQAAAFVVAQGL